MTNQFIFTDLIINSRKYHNLLKADYLTVLLLLLRNKKKLTFLKDSGLSPTLTYTVKYKPTEKETSYDLTYRTRINKSANHIN